MYGSSPFKRDNSRIEQVLSRLRPKMSLLRTLSLYGVLKEYAFWLFQKKNATKICSLNGSLNQKTGYRIEEENAPLIKYVFDIVLQFRRICRYQTIDSYFDEDLFSSQYGDAFCWLPVLMERYPNLFSESFEETLTEIQHTGNYERFKSMTLLEVMACIRDIYLGHNVMQTSLPLRWWIDSLGDRGSVLAFEFHSNAMLNAKHLTFVGKASDKVEDVLESFAFQKEASSIQNKSKVMVPSNSDLKSVALKEPNLNAIEYMLNEYRFEGAEGPKDCSPKGHSSFGSQPGQLEKEKEDNYLPSNPLPPFSGYIPRESFSDIFLPSLGESKFDAATKMSLLPDIGDSVTTTTTDQQETNGVALRKEPTVSEVVPKVRKVVSDSLSLTTHETWESCLQMFNTKERSDGNDDFLVSLSECVNVETQRRLNFNLKKRREKNFEKGINDEEAGDGGGGGGDNDDNDGSERWRDLKNDVLNEKPGESTCCSDHLKFYFGLFEISSYERNVFFDHFPVAGIWECKVFKAMRGDSLKKLKLFYQELDVFLRLLMRFKLVFCPELLRENVSKMFNESFCSKYDVSWYDYEGKNALEFVRRRITTDAGHMLEQMYNSLSVKIKIKSKEGESELLEEFRTDLKTRGFIDGMRLRLISSSIGNKVQKFMSPDSAYVLHRAQWTNKANLEWFNLRRWPVLCFVDGSYRCVYEGKRWYHCEVGREIFDYIERLQDNRYVNQCRKNYGEGTEKYKMFMEIVKFWRTLKRFVTGGSLDDGEDRKDTTTAIEEEERMVSFTSDEDMCGDVIRNTKNFLCEDEFLDRHAYDLLFPDRFLDSVVSEWKRTKNASYDAGGRRKNTNNNNNNNNKTSLD